MNKKNTDLYPHISPFLSALYFVAFKVWSISRLHNNIQNLFIFLTYLLYLHKS